MMRTDKLSCRKYLLFGNKGTPSRKKDKTDFSVLTTIQLNLLDEFTYPANDGLRTMNLEIYLLPAADLTVQHLYRLIISWRRSVWTAEFYQ
jgi:hypothetical protein